jgi:uncharacterized membrane protein YgcG
MKKLSVILLAFVLLIGTGISAASVELKKDKKTVSQEIGMLLKDANIDLEVDVNAYVTFMINEEAEIVVLTIDTKDEMIERFIKSRLNYHKLQNELIPGQEYQVPIRIKA